jgi:hypothetical protein
VAGDGPFAEHDRQVERYGCEKAEWVMQQMLGSYTRLALIDTGHRNMKQYQDHARRTASR